MQRKAVLIRPSCPLPSNQPCETIRIFLIFFNNMGTNTGAISVLCDQHTRMLTDYHIYTTICFTALSNPVEYTE
jgi:hypothetical protein